MKVRAPLRLGSGEWVSTHRLDELYQAADYVQISFLAPFPINAHLFASLLYLYLYTSIVVSTGIPYRIRIRILVLIDA